MEVVNVMRVSKTMEDTVLSVPKELFGVIKPTLASMYVVKILLLTMLPTNVSATPDSDFWMEFVMHVLQTTSSAQDTVWLVQSTLSSTERQTNVIAVKGSSLMNSESAQENAEPMKNMIKLFTNASAWKVSEKSVELAQFVLQDQSPPLTVQDVQAAKSTNNLSVEDVHAKKDMPTTVLESVPFVLIFPTDSWSMESAQSAQTTWFTTETMAADVHQEKFWKEPHVSVNAKLMSWLMPTEIATLVEIIKLSQMDSASVLLDMPWTVAESVFFPVPMEPSTSKEVVPFVPLTLFTRKKSEDAHALMDTTRIPSEFAPRLSWDPLTVLLVNISIKT